jgi:DNA-directed RNA polymerase subunit RPC12/RpoP
MCNHKSVRFATSSDMQDVCLDCGSVLKDYSDTNDSLQSDESEQEVCIDCGSSNILEGTCVDCASEFESLDLD